MSQEEIRETGSECPSNCTAKREPHTHSFPYEESPEMQRVAQRMRRVKHRILVLSGKGGVGKSTVAVNLAVGLARSKKQVGLMDIDIHGPSVPKLLHLERRALNVQGDTIIPITVGDRIKVMSIGFFLPSEDVAVIWRGPRKYGLIQQFLADVEWGDLDVLVVDSPPGTGDEPLGVTQMIGKVDGAVIVTTPQQVAVLDVRKCVTFCEQLGVPILGIVENMSGFVCPKCGERFDIFKSRGGQNLAKEVGVPLLGTIPIEPEIVAACDNGEPYLEKYSYTDAGRAFDGIAQSVLKALANGHRDMDDIHKKEGRL
jgi:Mrp family chromosome partitioning ATPase